MTNGNSPPGWYQDPTGQSDGRYWNGTMWTQISIRGGQTINIPIDPTIAQTPPVPGTQVRPPVHPQASGVPSSGSSGGVIIALVVGLLLMVAVVFALNDDSVDDTPNDGTVPAEEAPADTEAPAEEG
jgi:hypothetical protein